ncbi:DUF397 domain-containing protein [Actinacidiphila bryophytorum]|uniref:DUF397 domain-containing protein n=1 Tax=Actinacidiphila bryophytorum TaxID=1436133 RepID=A0A9W4MGM7_9ACTN|nr:DUF397 domain-containing protein [Actinacidiphila bryophytorum]MBM9440009.1 DUF397 domain-containing protein [Actinacidiphila bryophytorum]MBN6546391.1 DUF397 domain-containing protein [Actinacidiphila bryophytorum]CAG7639814.1 conserved hypothetical protein [Actinacidiphila bryophytorum]
MHLNAAAVTWRKSTYSSGDSDNCIEASDSLTHARWRKSTYSDGTGGNCVQVADDGAGVVPVRDSKDPQGPVLAFTPAAWTAFVGAAARGEFTRV